MPLLLCLQSLLVPDFVSLFCTSYCPICVEGTAWFRRMSEDYTYLTALQERLCCSGDGRRALKMCLGAMNLLRFAVVFQHCVGLGLA